LTFDVIFDLILDYDLGVLSLESSMWWVLYDRLCDVDFHRVDPTAVKFMEDIKVSTSEVATFLTASPLLTFKHRSSVSRGEASPHEAGKALVRALGILIRLSDLLHATV
jgi:hypothetical protein